MILRTTISHLIVATIGVALTSFIVWSVWAELDQVTRAPGRVVPYDRVQVVQTEEGGAIRAINVQEGDLVRRGELLVVLDQVKPGAAVEEMRMRIAALRSRLTRINAELLDKPLVFSSTLDNYPDLIANQRVLFDRRKAALDNETSSLQALAKSQEEELDLNLPLVQIGDVARSELIRMQRAVIETDGRIANLRSQYVQELQTEFTRTEEELIAAEQQLAQRQDFLRATQLRAPMDGIVKNVRLTTLGGVLRQGDEVLQIVPNGEHLIVEAQVPPRDIAFVKVGQRARVNFDAFDPSVYGSGEGRVVYVSPDTLSDQRDDGTTPTYYMVKLEVQISPRRDLPVLKEISIQPGMLATVEILTGRSTVWRFLTKPLTKTIGDSLTDR